MGLFNTGRQACKYVNPFLLTAILAGEWPDTGEKLARRRQG